jgi:hypothetical protein
MKPRIYVDFNTMNMLDTERVYIGRPDDAAETRALPPLVHGMDVILYDEEMEVEATVEWLEVRPGYAIWQALPDWASRRDIPFPE